MSTLAAAPPHPSAIRAASIPPSSSNKAHRFLEAAATYWLSVTIIGQVAFLLFIVAFYWSTSLTGNFAAWAKNTILPHGYIAGDFTGNLAFAIHAVIAGIVVFGGVLQLVPQVRRASAGFHRWNGRVFLTALIAASLSGLFLNWWRSAANFPIGLNAVLILLCAWLAWRAALARDFVAHRQWALRTFMVAGGVWFLRLGYLAWFIVGVKVLGAPSAATDVFSALWPYGCYLLPLAVTELYMRAKESARNGTKIIAGVTVCFFTTLMVLGIFAVSGFLWLPLVMKLWA